jgi:hypothetical protein
LLGLASVPTPIPRRVTEHRLRRARWLSGRRGQITVAGQRRTLTGFAIMRSHPGGSAPGLYVFILLYIVYTDTAPNLEVTKVTLTACRSTSALGAP